MRALPRARRMVDLDKSCVNGTGSYLLSARACPTSPAEVNWIVVYSPLLQPHDILQQGIGKQLCSLQGPPSLPDKLALSQTSDPRCCQLPQHFNSIIPSHFPHCTHTVTAVREGMLTTPCNVCQGEEQEPSASNDTLGKMQSPAHRIILRAGGGFNHKIKGQAGRSEMGPDPLDSSHKRETE